MGKWFLTHHASHITFHVSRFAFHVSRFTFHASLLLLLLSLAACVPDSSSHTVTLIADGETRSLASDALTVRDLLAEASITLDENDRAAPVETTFVENGMTVRVIRVEVHSETEQRELPFERRTVHDASIPEGENRLLEPGVTGIEELTYRVTVEDGVEVEWQLVQRVTLQEPRTEVILIGIQAELKPVPITGTVAYIANHNGWAMQTTSLNQRRLTHTGDMDGRVFALSPDGSYLLHTRVALPSTPLNGEEPPTVSSQYSGANVGQIANLPHLPRLIERIPPTPVPSNGEETPPSIPPNGGEEGGETAPLNTLWIIETATADAEPMQLQAESILWADWDPNCKITPTSTGCRIAYSTGTQAEGSPGWKAENDLWIARFRPSDGQLVGERRFVEPSAGGAYGWWGTTHAWSPDGRSLAYARANEVGVINSASGAQTPLARFPPYRTYAPWVWTPTVSWSPEGKFIVTTLHGPAPTGEAPEDSPVFDIWALAADGTITAELTSEAGMWAAPAYAPEGDHIVFGHARSPYTSYTSGYALYLMDRDGSDRRPLFPPEEEIGLEYPEMAWGPGGDRLIIVYQGNLGSDD